MKQDSESASTRLESSWDSNADLWTDAVRQVAIPSRTAGTDQAVIDAIANANSTSVIDVGCGEGWLSRRIKSDLSCEAIGIDISATLIEHARQADPTGLYAALAYQQLTNLLTNMAGAFDTAVCNFSLLDEDLNSTLSAINQLLSDSGVLIIQTLHCGQP